MATYVNDLRLKEIATGDESGTWGASTNTNLELIAEAFSFGTEAITTNADTHTTTIADGSTDPGRSLFLKYTGTLDSTCTITIGPNTVSKLWLIENATSGSQSIIIKQGSGATITIPNGQTKAIYSDGAGSGAAMVDAFTDLNVAGTFTADGGVKVDNITIDGTEIDLSSGDLTIDVAGDIILDADGGDVNFKDAGTEYLRITNAVSGPEIFSPSNDGDLFFKGVDGGSTITALTLDMSAAGIATFNSGINIGNRGSASDPTLQSSIDPDTGVFWGGSNILGFASGGAERLRVSSEVVVNDPSNDVDFRVESDGNANAFFVDAGNNRIGLFSSGPTESITFDGSSSSIFEFRTGTQAMFRPPNNDNDHRIVALTSNGLDIVHGGATSTSMQRWQNQTGVVFNEDSVDQDFRIESNGNTHMVFVDAGNDEVGIGTSDPRSPLHVQTSHTSTDVTAANTNSTLSIGNSGSGDGVYNSIKFSGNQQDMYIMSVNDSTQADRRLGFFVGSVAGDATTDERLSIKGDGSVGIGTSSPSARATIKTASNEEDAILIEQSDGTDVGSIRINNGSFLIKGKSSSAPVQLQSHDGNEDIEVDPDGFIKFETAGSERVNIDSAGATTFSGNVKASDILASGSGGLSLQTDDGVKRITLEDSGTITVGTNSVAAAVTINARRSTATGDILRLSGGNSNVGEFAVILIHGENVTGGTQKGIITFNTIDVAAVGDATLQERMRVAAAGDVFIGKTSSSVTTKGVTIAKNGTSEFISQGNNNTPMAIGSQDDSSFTLVNFHGASSTPGGSISIVNGNSVAYNTSSDYRLKENITDLTSATDRLKQLTPKRFNFIGDADRAVDGFLAHELSSIVPEAVTGEKDAIRDEEYEVTPAVRDDDGNLVKEAVMGTRSVPDYQGIDQSKLVPLLVATIKELEARIAALESE